MIAGTVLMMLGGLGSVLHIGLEVDKNAKHNKTVLDLTKHTERDADRISKQILPAFQALHSLDVAATRHVAEFELHILDFERDERLLMETLAALEAAFAEVPEEFPGLPRVHHDRLKEIVDVFVDITNEALEIRSPNKLFQLLSDSEDVFREFRGELDHARIQLDESVNRMTADIAQDLGSVQANLSIQQEMLKHLGAISIWGLSILILFVLVITSILFRVLHRRLDAVADYARAIADGRYSSVINFVSRDRIGDMAESVGFMGSRMAALLNDAQNKAITAERAERSVRKLAYYDSLTDLPNRQHFFEILNSAIEEARRLEEKVAVVYMDLDDFKKVNDSFGHNVGDRLLCAVAGRLAHSVRDVDAIARSVGDSPVPMLSRLGGDEFTFLINRLGDRSEAAKIVRRIFRALVRPYQVDERELSVTTSLGVAVFPDDGLSADQLLKHADMAMYQAKEYGRNTIKFFNPVVGELKIRELELERDLGRALDRGELSIHYQAKVNLSSLQVVGAEALLRWRHPQHGMVSPMEFIPLAEATGLIVPIGNWVLKQVCSQLVQWQSENIAPVPIAVNISARQLAQADLVSVVSDCVGSADICAGHIELELTESSLMNDMALAISTIRKLREIGVKVSIDDFGTGYSSLSYLRQFPLSTLKIDRSFVRDIATDPDDETIVKAIIGLSNSLGLKVIAEGVEDQHQVSFLRKHGCQEAQGYLFGKPVPAHEFARILAQGKVSSVA